MALLLLIFLCIIAKQGNVFAATTAQNICDVQGSVGLYPNPDDTACKQYAKCFVNNGAIVGSFYNCTGTTLFNPSVQQCVVGYTCIPTTTTTTTETPTPTPTPTTTTTETPTTASTTTTTNAPTTKTKKTTTTPTTTAAQTTPNPTTTTTTATTTHHNGR